MTEFFKNLLLKILSYIIILFLLILFYFYLLTGEFPPKKSTVIKKYHELSELRQQYMNTMKISAERLKQAENFDPSALQEQLAQLQNQPPVQVIPVVTNDQMDTIQNKFNELRTEQNRLYNEIQIIKMQNKAILDKLNSVK